MLTPAVALVVALTVCLLGIVSDAPVVHAAGKLGASAAFLAAAWAVDLAGVAPHGPWMVAGLIASALGDALLLSHDKRFFLAGLGAFLLAHVAYAVAFATLGPSPSGVAIGAAAMVGVGWGTLRWLGDRPGKLRGPVIAYVVAIGTMVALASALTDRPLIGVGAAVFAASDLFVARHRFMAAEPRNRLVGLPLYFAAQLLLIAGAAG